MGWLPSLAALVATLASAFASSMLEAATAQPAALELLAAPGIEPGEEDVLLSLERGWFESAKRVLALMRERDAPVAAMASVRASATNIRDQATEIINLMRTGANAEETVVTTAFQWAQRPEFVYLNVKFSSRIDGPVTCLNVDNERIEFGNEPAGNGTAGTLFFEGTGRQKPKLFRLNLTLHGAILPENSSWSFASVGRMSITIAKATHETWPRLLLTKVKPKNMHVWHDRQHVADAEVKKEKEDRKKEREAGAKEAPKPPPPLASPTPPSNAPPPSPEAPSEPADGAKAAAAASDAPPVPFEDGLAQPAKKKGKKKKEKKGDKKEEL
jgi:hypothetical protein|eukprot:jgi/Chrpa1/25074/Chrysochromulina_OHIO_Genome00002879-RA